MALNDHLRFLDSCGLIRPVQDIPQLEYLFRHALVQDAAYESLLRQDRKHLHHVVGEMLERSFLEGRTELAPILGQHFVKGGDEERALKYFAAAGDDAARRYANPEALLHYTRALEIAERLRVRGQSLHSVSTGLLDLYARRGRVLELSSRYDEALQMYAEMEAGAREFGDRAMELAALIASATIRSTANPTYDASQARALLQQAWALALALDDRASEAKILWNLLLVATLDNESSQVRIDYGERALALARELGMLEQRALILNDIWYAYASSGRWERASAALAEAQHIWRSFGNLPMLAENLTRAAVSQFVAGDYEQAIANGIEANQISRASNNIDGQANSLGMTGRSYIELGRLAEAMTVMQTAIGLGEQVGNVTALTGTQADLGWVYGWLGMTQEGFALAYQAQSAAQKLFPFLEPWSMIVIARLHLLDGRLEEAQATLARVGDIDKLRERLGFIAFIWGDAALAHGQLALARHDSAQALHLMQNLYTTALEMGSRFLLPDILHLQGQAFIDLRRMDDAHAVLAQARTAAEEMASRRALWPILTTLADVEEQRSHSDEADDMRGQARDIVQSIGGQLSDDRLRRSFLGTRDVTRLLGHGALASDHWVSGVPKEWKS